MILIQFFCIELH